MRAKSRTHWQHLRRTSQDARQRRVHRHVMRQLLRVALLSFGLSLFPLYASPCPCVYPTFRPLHLSIRTSSKMLALKPMGHLVPPLFEQGAVKEFEQSGRTLGLTVSPRDGTAAMYIAPNVCSYWIHSWTLRKLADTHRLILNLPALVPLRPKANKYILRAQWNLHVQSAEW